MSKQVEPEDEWGGFKAGDRVVYIGPTDEFASQGEEGVVVDVYKPAGALVVAWDKTSTCDMAGPAEMKPADDEKRNP